MKHLLIYLTLFFTTNAFTSQDQIKEELGEDLVIKTTHSTSIKTESLDEEYKKLDPNIQKKINELIESLKKNKSDNRKIELSVCDLNARMIIFSLSKVPYPEITEELDLSFNLFKINENSNLTNIEQTLATFTNIKSITLENNDMQKSITYLGSTFGQYKELNFLNIANNYINKTDILIFLKILQSTRSNSTIKLQVIASANNLNEQEQTDILNAFPNSNTLEVIFEDFSQY